eukprot:scaffold20382_cov129-Isochrysis_galbana.AAC.2
MMFIRPARHRPTFSSMKRAAWSSGSMPRWPKAKMGEVKKRCRKELTGAVPAISTMTESVSVTQYSLLLPVEFWTATGFDGHHVGLNSSRLTPSAVISSPVAPSTTTSAGIAFIS